MTGSILRNFHAVLNNRFCSAPMESIMREVLQDVAASSAFAYVTHWILACARMTDRGYQALYIFRSTRTLAAIVGCFSTRPFFNFYFDHTARQNLAGCGCDIFATRAREP